MLNDCKADLVYYTKYWITEHVFYPNKNTSARKNQTANRKTYVKKSSMYLEKNVYNVEHFCEVYYKLKTQVKDN